MIWHGLPVYSMLQRGGQREEESCTKVAVGGGCAPGCEVQALVLSEVGQFLIRFLILTHTCNGT